MSHGGPDTAAQSIYDENAKGKGVVRIASVAALGGFLFGYDSAVINGAVAAVEEEFSAEPLALGFAVASALLGAALGAFVSGRIADRIGRLSVMRIAAVLFLISALVTGFAPNLTILVVGRVIGGLGVGMASVIAPAYIAEISPARIRGRLGSLQQLAIVTGIFISLLIDWLIAARGRRIRRALLARPGCLAMDVPHDGDPRHHLRRALADDPGVAPLPHLQAQDLGGDRDPDEAAGRREHRAKVKRIRETMEREDPPSWRDLKGPSGRVAGIVWIGLLLSMFQQFVGINVIFYYSNILWEAVGFSEGEAFIFTVISATINILTTLIAIATVDRFGRKPLLLIGSVGMAVTLSTMAIIFGTARVVDGEPVLTGAAGVRSR